MTMNEQSAQFLEMVAAMLREGKCHAVAGGGGLTRGIEYEPGRFRLTGRLSLHLEMREEVDGVWHPQASIASEVVQKFKEACAK